MSLTDTLHGPRGTAVMFAALAAFWGTSFVAIQAGVPYFPPLLFAAVRYAVAGGVVLAYAACTTDRWVPRTRGGWLRVAVGGLLVIAVYHGLLYIGERSVPGAVASIVVSTSPVLTAVFATAVLDDASLGPLELVGFAFGLVGVVVVAAPGAGVLAATGVVPVLLVFGSAAAFSLGGVLTRPFETTVPLRTTQAWTMLVGAGVLFAGAAVRGESVAAIEWTPTAVASLAYLTLVSGALAFLIYFALLERAGPGTVHLVSYLEPVVATVMSALLLGDVVAPTALAGFAAVFAGFAVVERHRLRAVASRVTRRLGRDDPTPNARGRHARSETSD